MTTLETIVWQDGHGPGPTWVGEIIEVTDGEEEVVYQTQRFNVQEFAQRAVDRVLFQRQLDAVNQRASNAGAR